MKFKIFDEHSLILLALLISFALTSWSADIIADNRTNITTMTIQIDKLWQENQKLSRAAWMQAADCQDMSFPYYETYLCGSKCHNGRE